MTLHTDFEDDYPVGIEADPFDPLPAPFTRTEIAIILGGCAVGATVGYHWVLPYLRVAATAALLLASAR